MLSGGKVDNPLYSPAIRQVREGMGRRGLVYVGDSKLMSLDNRAYIQAGGDYYLVPFTKVQIPDENQEADLAYWQEYSVEKRLCAPES